MTAQINANKFLNLLKTSPRLIAIDVRSESEFSEGQLPQSVNIPILNNEHRKAVGITYKMQGQSAAMDVGHELVNPIKPELIDQWSNVLKKFPSEERIVFCWRGGLRSQLTCEWIKESGLEAMKVEGGYKACRNLLINSLAQDYELILLTGLTGSGKTKLLQRLKQDHVLDLEAYANHRGSAFGPMVKAPQPSQQTFENRLGMGVLNRPTLYIVEHEGKSIGKVIIPKVFQEKMQNSPMVFLERTMEERIMHIFHEYVESPIKSQMATLDELKQILINQLSKIKKRLGLAKHMEIESMLKHSFEAGVSLSQHAGWIEALLLFYYDRQYQYAITHFPSDIIFRGNEQECYEFMNERLTQIKTNISHE